MNILAAIYAQKHLTSEGRLKLLEECKERTHPMFNPHHHQFLVYSVIQPDPQTFIDHWCLQFYKRDFVAYKDLVTHNGKNIELHYTVDEPIIPTKHFIDFKSDDIKCECDGHYIGVCSLQDGFKICKHVYSMPVVRRKVMDEVRDKVGPTKYRYLEYQNGKIQMTRDKAAEYEAAIQVEGAVFELLSSEIRKIINGGACSKDCGIDVVGPGLQLYQVKYYQDGDGVGNAAIAKLNNIANAFENKGAGSIPIRNVILRRNTHLCHGAPGGDRIHAIELEEDVKIDEKEFSNDDYTEEHKTQLETQQNIIMAAIIAHPERTQYRIKMPTGTGKSYIIRRICQLYPNTPVFVFTPRILILTELIAFLQDLTNVGVYSLQSSKSIENIEPGFILIRDEAHYGENGEFAKELNKKGPAKTFLLSATLDNPDKETNIALSFAIENKLICRPDVRIPLYTSKPTFENIADYLIENTEMNTVLICHETQDEAKEATRIMKEKHLNAETYISDEKKQEGKEHLENFKNGTLRILNVVLCVEMGVNVKRIDTIIFMYQWKSDKRLIQLIGRGTRFHPSKGSNFNVVIPSSYTQLKTKSDDLFKALEDFYGPGQVMKHLNIELMKSPSFLTENEDGKDEKKEYEETPEYIKELAYTYDRRPLNVVGLRQQYEDQKAYLKSRGINGKGHIEALRMRFPECYMSIQDTPKTFFKDLSDFDYDDFLSRPVNRNKVWIEQRKAELRGILQGEDDFEDIPYDAYRYEDPQFPWEELE